MVVSICFCSPQLLPPSYAPELQPAERLWTVVREPISNRSIDTLDELEDILVKRCRYMRTQKDSNRSRTLYHWWPKDNEIN